MSLSIAVPSKGRLEENARQFFARAGLSLTRGRGARDYRGGIDGYANIEVSYLSASEIARGLADGGLHVGITGLDLVQETVPDHEAALVPLIPLGFGHADVVIAVPEAWIDVDTVADLSDVSILMRQRDGRVPRIATKYLTLTRRYLAGLGMADHRDYRLIESAGATEGAPASGTADLIVDITTTGSTLRANGLKVLSDGTILKSQAHLVASLRAEWGDAELSSLKAVLSRIDAEARARTTRIVTAIAEDKLVAQISEIVDADPFISPGPTGEMMLRFQLPAADVLATADRMREAGARHISITAAEYLVEPDDPVFDLLVVKLKRL
ncbi:MAG: ATP phosphoribosyltransferase [Pseudomonadota bacterium]